MSADPQFGCDFLHDHSALDPLTRWCAYPGPDLLHVPVGGGRVLDLGGHLLITGAGAAALSLGLQAWLADNYSPDAVQFAVANLGWAQLAAPHVATSLLGLAEQPGQGHLLARVLDDELWRRGGLSAAELAAEPALLVVLDDADATAEALPGVLEVLHRIGRDGAPLRMHLLLTAADPAALPGLPVQRISPDAGMVVPGDEQIAEIVATFQHYRHAVRSLLTPPAGLTHDRLLRYERPADGEILLGVVHDYALTPLKVDFATLPHLVLGGSSEEGRRQVRHTVLRRIAERYGRHGAVVADASRLDALRPILLARLGNRASWQGPEIFLMADEPDADALVPHAELLRHGASIGVHLIASAGEHHPLLREIPVPDRLEIQADPGGLATFAAGGVRGLVQIALDLAEPIGELGSPESLAPPAPPARRLTAVLGRSGIAEPVHLDVTTHAWCAGYVGTGKTALLRRIAVSLATRYSPDAVQLLIAEHDNTALAPLAGLPHTAEYLSVSEVPDMRRFRRLLDDELVRRLHLEAEGLLATAPQLVVLADEPRFTGAAIPEFGRTLRQVVALGRRLGISLVLTDRFDGSGEPDFAALEEAITTRVALQALSEQQLGRFLRLPAAPKMVWIQYGQAYLRVGDGEPRLFRFEPVTPAEFAEAACGVRGPAVRALPLSPPSGMFGYDDLLRVSDPDQPGLPLGMSAGGPVTMDLEQYQHFLVLGEPRTGRSTVLRTLLRGITRRYTAEQCAVVLLRDLATRDAVPPAHLAESIAYGSPADVVDDMLTGLRRRVGTTWTGPRLFVVIDDHDQFTAQEDPLAAMRDVLPYAREIGLHFLVAGTAGIVMRAEIADLLDAGAPRLFLDEATHPGTAVGELPPIPAVGHGEVVPWKQAVRLPWS